MIAYLQSLPYSAHLLVGGVEFALVGIVCPVLCAMTSAARRRSLRLRRWLIFATASLLLLPCVLVGLLFAVAVLPSAYWGSGSLPPTQAATVPIISAAAGASWWYTVAWGRRLSR